MTLYSVVTETENGIRILEEVQNPVSIPILSVLERLRTQLFTGFHKICVRFGNVVGSTCIVSETNRK